MNKAFNAWATIADKYDVLSRRERLMVFVAGLVIILGFFETVLFDPVMQKQNLLKNEISQLQSSTSEINTQLTALTVNPAIDIDTQNREKLGSLRQTLQTQSQALSGMNSALVSPDGMPALLEGLLAKHAAVKLVAMKTLPVENLFKQTTEPATPSAQTENDFTSGTPLFYKHNLEITLSGNYLDLLQYAEALERLPIHPLWNQAQLSVKDYPVCELKITLYTLSLDKTWLSI